MDILTSLSTELSSIQQQDRTDTKTEGEAVACIPSGTQNKTATARCPICITKLKPHEQAFTCKCNQTFCSKHRLAEAHECKFDHKALHAQRIQAANPKVVAAKVAHI